MKKKNKKTTLKRRKKKDFSNIGTNISTYFLLICTSLLLMNLQLFPPIINLSAIIIGVIISFSIQVISCFYIVN